MKTTRRDTLKRLVVTGGALSIAGCTGGNSNQTNGSNPTTTMSSRETTTSSSMPSTSQTTTSGDTSTSTAATTAPSSERGDYTVGMYTELYFDPIGLYVEPGETVSFELVSGAHSATAYHPNNPNALERRVPKDTPAWDTGTFGEVDSFRNITFETEGTHDYYCIPHKMVGMIGRIVVGSPGGPAESSENPDGPLPASDEIVNKKKIAGKDWKSQQR